MSASLAQSIAWDSMTTEEKRAAVTIPLCNGQHYQFKSRWGTAVLKCLNERTLQFRVVKQQNNPGFSEPDLTGYLVTMKPEDVATLTHCSKPFIPTSEAA
jgi:hypothetical protein